MSMQTDLHNGDNAGLVLDDPTPKTPLLGPLLWRASQEVQDICATLGVEPGPPIEVESIQTDSGFHNGYHTGFALDDYIPESPLMRFNLRHICQEEQDLCKAWGIEIRIRTVQRAYKFRLTDISPEQHEMLPQFFGNERFVWNKLLAEQKERIARGESVMSHFDMNSWIIILKSENPFLKISPSQALQARASKLAKAFAACFDKENPAKSPKFKVKFKSKNSFSIPQGVTLTGTDSITLPKLGTMYFINGGDNPAREKTCRVIEGTIKNTTISLDTCGVHWISVQTEMTVEEVVHTSDSIVGLDLGCVRYATLSNGAYYLPLNALDKQLDRLALLQQKMARQATRFT